MTTTSHLNRRSFLRRAGLATAAGTLLPVLGGTAFASAKDPDQLFKAGRFAEAERGYRRRLHKNPSDAHAAAQVGYIALLSNRFGAAKSFLARAIKLNSSDAASQQRLAECFVRQDQHARAIPLLQAGDDGGQARATQYSHLTGTPWRIYGASSTRLPFLTLDPLPSVEASVNNGEPKKFVLDTGGTLSLSQEAAQEAGLRAVASVSGIAGGTPVTAYLGVLDSLRLGDIEIRDIPVQWSDKEAGPPDGSPHAGVIGTTVFYHFLTTMDYAGQALVLRRKTHKQRPGLPLWLAGDHFPCTLGSLGDYGPRIVTLDTGGIDDGFETTVEIAERSGLDVDYAHPVERPGTTVYPVTAGRISLGKAVGRHIEGTAAREIFPGFPGPGLSETMGFDAIANFTHEFFKPFAVTFDYTGMTLSITRR